MTLDNLRAEVAHNSEVVASAITLINGLADKIEELKADPVALQQLADELHAQHEALAAEVAANTPSE